MDIANDSYVMLQVRGLEYFKILKMIDDYNKHRDLCRERKIPKNTRKKDKSDTFNYPVVLGITPTVKLRVE